MIKTESTLASILSMLWAPVWRTGWDVRGAALGRSPLMWIMDSRQEARIEWVQVSILTSSCPSRHLHTLCCVGVLQRHALHQRALHGRCLELKVCCR